MIEIEFDIDINQSKLALMNESDYQLLIDSLTEDEAQRLGLFKDSPDGKVEWNDEVK